MIFLFCSALAAAVLAGAAYLGWQFHRRSMGPWIGTYALETRRRKTPQHGQPIHVLLCVADHFEPHRGHVSGEVARRRIETWLREFPRLYGHLRDSDGLPPRHTFFFPLEQYNAEHLELLTELCRQGYGEVEVHLHHDDDTSEQLRRRLLEFKDLLASRHNQLARHKMTGELAYAFIHGNWALDNSRPDGRWCGVNNELDVLRETGCYADFTMPSAPSPTQTRKINSIYYAVDDPQQPKSHDSGVDAGTGHIPAKALLLIQGPLLLNWRNRKWGILPRVENGCIQGNQPPTLERLRLWLRARVQVGTRADWYFVKLHTHGAPEANQAVLLGQPMLHFHQQLACLAEQDANFHFHYVTAREMYNLVRAAESGWQGSVLKARDFQLHWNGSAQHGTNELGRLTAAPT
jgi:hypothetical protein